MDLQKGNDGVSTIHRTVGTSPSRQDERPQHDTHSVTTSTTPSRGTTMTQPARRDMWNMTRVWGKGTTTGLESGARTVKAGPRGNDRGSHASQTSVSLNSQGLESQPYVMGGKVRNSQTLMNTPRRMGTPVVVASRTRLDGPRTRLVAPRRPLRVPLPVSDVRCSTRVVVVRRAS